MAYYWRWENDLSGGGNYQPYYWPDSKGDDADVSWIFAPLKMLSKLPYMKRTIGFLIALPLVVVIGIILLVLAGLFLIIGQMALCWRDIINSFGRDMVSYYRWIYRRRYSKRGIKM